MKRFSVWLGNVLRPRYMIVAFSATLILTWTACVPGTIQFPSNDATFITIVPDNATIDVGQQLAFTVQLTKKGVTTNADPALFNWISSGPAVATVDNRGVALGVKPGHVTVQAQSKSQSSNAGAAGLDVVTAPPVAIIAAIPEAITVRFRNGREVSYVADGARHLLRTTFAEKNGEITQVEAFVPAIEGKAWLAIDPSASMIFVLSRDSHQLLALPVDVSTGEVEADKVKIYAIDVDVFAIAAGMDGSLVLHHLHGADSRLSIRDTE